MSATNLNRRQFAGRIGAGLGAVLIAPELLRSVAEARLPATGPRDVVQLNSNENPYGPSHRALKAMSESQHVASRYPDAAEASIIDAIAKLHNVAPENVILGCGSGDILRMADMAFLAAGKGVVVCQPTFEAVLGYARATHADPVQIPQTADFRHDLPAMAAACNSNTGLVYICNPNNPTGTVVSKDEMAAFFSRVPQSATILVDEAYHHFVEDPRYASAFEWWGKQPNLVICRTFSKIFGMAGMRLGYAVGPKEKIEAMRMHLTFSNANAAVLDAALASLNDPTHVPSYKKKMNDTRRWLCAELTKDGRKYIPSETNFVMINIGTDVGPLIDKFKERKILIGRRFPSMSDWLRISIGTDKEMKAFVSALRAIVPAQGMKAA